MLYSGEEIEIDLTLDSTGYSSVFFNVDSASQGEPILQVEILSRSSGLALTIPTELELTFF